MEKNKKILSNCDSVVNFLCHNCMNVNLLYTGGNTTKTIINKGIEYDCNICENINVLDKECIKYKSKISNEDRIWIKYINSYCNNITQNHLCSYSFNLVYECIDCQTVGIIYFCRTCLINNGINYFLRKIHCNNCTFNDFYLKIPTIKNINGYEDSYMNLFLINKVLSGY